MREILFRGKRLDNGKWIEGFYGVKIGDKHYIIIDKLAPAPCCDSYFVDCAVIPETVGQYTGLKDRFSRRIFEGDIVRLYSTYHEELIGDNCVVEYGVFNCSCCDGIYGWEFKDGDIRNFDEYEIIGNIHDNPELLKEAGKDENT